MADSLNDIMKPAGASSNADEPVIHVIPEKFYGAALKKKVVNEPKPAAPTGGAMPPAVPPSGEKPITEKPAGKKGKLGLVIAIVVLLLVVGGGAAYFLMTPKPTPTANVPVATNTKPAGPECGNAKCEAPDETHDNCAADCPAPAPRCGDQKCDADTENNAVCPQDCAPPAPVCGDKRCDAPTETVNSCPDDCQRQPATVGPDADGDGLSDEEESSLYHTSPNDPDTDKDSYVDNNEVLTLFDPATPSPAPLSRNSGIAVYTNADQGYEIFRPAAWQVKEEDAAKKTVYFNATSGEFIMIMVTEKDPGTSLADWYKAQAQGNEVGNLTEYVTRQGYKAMISPTQTVHYVDLGNHVAVLTYDPGTRNQLQYKVTFQMMAQSLRKTN